MRSPFLRRAATALAAATLAALAGCTHDHRSGFVGPAPSVASQWKIAQVIGPPDGDSLMDDISATGPRDAWAIAQVCGSSRCTHGSATLQVERWDGTGWRQVAALPGPVLHAQNAFVGASSGTDAWVLAEFDRGADALHWDGKHWTVFRAGGCGQVFPVVFGPGDAWAFSGGTRACASHFSGHSWQQVVMPGIPDAVSAASRNDIWAVGRVPSGTASPGYIAMHWDGRSWTAIAIPDLDLRSGQRLVGGNMVATGPRDVWVEYGVQAQGNNDLTGLLLHWDGASWHRIPVPLAPGGVWSMARDGRGGLWLTAEGSGPTGVNWYFYHLSRGRLTLAAAPAKRGTSQLYGAGQVVWVPGTASLWGIETLSSGLHGSQGTILRYGG
jgi:hypothetical protein